MCKLVFITTSCWLAHHLTPKPQKYVLTSHPNLPQPQNSQLYAIIVRSGTKQSSPIADLSLFSFSPTRSSRMARSRLYKDTHSSKWCSLSLRNSKSSNPSLKTWPPSTFLTLSHTQTILNYLLRVRPCQLSTRRRPRLPVTAAAVHVCPLTVLTCWGHARCLCVKTSAVEKTCLCAIWSWCHVETSRSHVGATDGLYLLHPAEFWFGQQLRTH